MLPHRKDLAALGEHHVGKAARRESELDEAFAKVKAEEALHDLKAEAEMLNISVEQVKRERDLFQNAHHNAAKRLKKKADERRDAVARARLEDPCSSPARDPL